MLLCNSGPAQRTVSVGNATCLLKNGCQLRLSRQYNLCHGPRSQLEMIEASISAHTNGAAIRAVQIFMAIWRFLRVAAFVRHERVKSDKVQRPVRVSLTALAYRPVIRSRRVRHWDMQCLCSAAAIRPEGPLGGAAMVCSRAVLPPLILDDDCISNDEEEQADANDGEWQPDELHDNGGADDCCCFVDIVNCDVLTAADRRPPTRQEGREASAGVQPPSERQQPITAAPRSTLGVDTEATRLKQLETQATRMAEAKFAKRLLLEEQAKAQAQNARNLAEARAAAERQATKPDTRNDGERPLFPAARHVRVPRDGGEAEQMRRYYESAKLTIQTPIALAARSPPAPPEQHASSSGDTPYLLIQKARRLHWRQQAQPAERQTEMFDLQFDIDRAERKKYEKKRRSRKS
eukprot:40795-Pleurochrysis_carterae.AAC.4